MKRILFAIFIWIVLIGGLALYMRHRDANPAAAAPGRILPAATAEYTLELTPSFAPVPDPFALVKPGEKAPAMTARLRGREVLRTPDGALAGRPVRVDKLPGVLAGINEVAVAASPPAFDSATTKAPVRNFLQARILENGVPRAEETFWADGTDRVAGVLRFDARNDDAKREDGQ